MILFDSFSTPPIGLDVGKRLVKAVQLGKSHGKPIVTATAVVGRVRPDTPVDTEEAQRIRRVLAQQGFVGRRVVLATPSEQLMSSVIDMPPKDSGAPYDLITKQEFARLQRQQPGGFEVCWWEVPRPARSSTTKVMAVGCAHTDSEPVIEAFTNCGLEVVALDAGVCAAVRACLHQLESDTGVSAVLDIGWHSSHLVLVHQGVVMIDRALSGTGIAKMQERVSLALGVETAEADALLQSVGLAVTDTSEAQSDERLHKVAPRLCRALGTFLNDIAGEVEASFEYAGHQYPGAEPRRLILCGGGGAVPGLAEQLDKLVTPETVRPIVPPARQSRHAKPGRVQDGVGQSTYSGALLLTALGLAGSGEGK